MVVSNLTTIYFQEQKLQSVLDQAALMGTNYLDLESYYHNSLLNTLQLDKEKITIVIDDFLTSNYSNKGVNYSRINVIGNEVTVELSINQQLPFQFPFEFVRINGLSSAKLVVD